MFKIINIRTITADNLGALSFIESDIDVPFDIKRVYYIHHAEQYTQRGGHAHKTLEQFLFCPFGSIEIKLIGRDMTEKSVVLSDPNKGLYITGGVWRNMLWLQKDSVLCVAASQYYNANDYIREFVVFERMVSSRYWTN